MYICIIALDEAREIRKGTEKAAGVGSSHFGRVKVRLKLMVGTQ
jgi:hypothetical protein